MARDSCCLHDLFVRLLSVRTATLHQCCLGMSACCTNDCERDVMCRVVKLSLRLRAECQVAIVGKSVISVWMILCFIAGVAYCAYRRTQLREKFGIAGASRGPSSVSCDIHPDDRLL